MPTIKDDIPKVTVLCQLFYPELVSTGQTLTELCEELVNMQVAITVICGPPTILTDRSKYAKVIVHKGIQIKRVWGTRFPKLKLWGRIFNHLTYGLSVFKYLIMDSAKNPMLVLTNPPFLPVICSIIRMIKGRSFIFLIFDVYPESAIKIGVIKRKGIISKLWNFTNKLAYKHASYIVVIGRCMKDVVMQHINEHATGKMRVIHVWSDDKLINPSLKKDNPFVDKWSLQDKFVILYSGNMGKMHDLETIMEAAKKLADYKDIEFLFVGEGYRKTWIMDYAKEFQLSNCQFHTYVEREELGFAITCADIGLVSLKDGHEGLSVPSKTFGIMSGGVPVIGIMPKTSEIALILEEEGCGFVADPGDSGQLINHILNLYNDRDRLKVMGNNARRAIDDKYNLHAAAESYYDLISTLNIDCF